MSSECSGRFPNFQICQNFERKTNSSAIYSTVLQCWILDCASRRTIYRRVCAGRRTVYRQPWLTSYVVSTILMGFAGLACFGLGSRRICFQIFWSSPQNIHKIFTSLCLSFGPVCHTSILLQKIGPRLSFCVVPFVFLLSRVLCAKHSKLGQKMFMVHVPNQRLGSTLRMHVALGVAMRMCSFAHRGVQLGFQEETKRARCGAPCLSYSGTGLNFLDILSHLPRLAESCLAQLPIARYSRFLVTTHLPA